MGRDLTPNQEVPLFVTDRAAWDAQTDWATGRWHPRTETRTRPAWQPAPQPGVLSKRPMRFAESLDAGFRLLRFSPGVSVGTAMIVLTLFLLAVSAAVAGLIWFSFGYVVGIAGNTEAVGGLSFLMQVGASAVSLLSLCFLHFLSGLLSIPARQAFFTPPGGRAVDARGQKTTTLRRTWGMLAGQRLRLIAATALLGGAHFAALALLLAPGVVIAVFTSQAVIGFLLAGLGALGWVVFTVFFMVRTAFVGCAIAVERMTIRQAFARSWQLTRRRFWATAGTLLLSYYLSSQLVGIIVFPLLLIFFIAALIVSLTFLDSTDADTFATVVIGVLTILGLAFTAAATAVLYAYQSGVITGLYFDRRMRFEGYDLLLLREAEELDRRT